MIDDNALRERILVEIYKNVLPKIQTEVAEDRETYSAKKDGVENTATDNTERDCSTVQYLFKSWSTSKP